MNEVMDLDLWTFIRRRDNYTLQLRHTDEVSDTNCSNLELCGLLEPNAAIRQ